MKTAQNSPDGQGNRRASGEAEMAAACGGHKRGLTRDFQLEYHSLSLGQILSCFLPLLTPFPFIRDSHLYETL